MSTLKKFLKDTFVYGLATVLPRLMHFILVPLHTGVLPNDAYAKNTSFYVWAAFFNVLLTYGMETAFFRFFTKYKEQKEDVYKTSFVALGATTILFFVMTWYFKDYVSAWLGMREDYFQILLLILAFDTLVVVPFAYLRATGKSLHYGLVKLLNIAVVVAINFYFFWYALEPISKLAPVEVVETHRAELVVYVFWANLAAAAVTLLVLLPLFFKVRGKFNKSILNKMLSYGWPIMVAGLAYVVNENLDKLLLSHYLGDTVMGAYAGCYKLAVFMTIAIQAFRLGAEPFFFNQAGEKNAKEVYAIILKYFIIACGLLMLVVVGFIDLFKEALVPNSSYWIAIDIVPIVLMANLMLGVYHNLAVWYKLTDRTRWGMYLSITGAILTIGLNILLIPRYGFIVSAWATLAAYGLMAVASYVLGQRYYKVPYDLKRMLLYLIYIGVGSGFLFLRFRESVTITIAIILSYILLVTVLERKELTKILKR